MSHLTTKWGLIIPDEADADDVPSWIDQLASKIDATITGWKADTWANRPVGVGLIDGLLFWATDQAQFYLVQGGTLHQISITFGAVGSVTTAAFGDAPGAGNPVDGAAPMSHRHGMPANPITGHLAAGDPHSQYALDTDLTPISTAATTAQTSSAENRLISLMRPGAACPNLRRVGFSVFAATQAMFTVPAGRKYIVKGITISAADAVNSGTASQPVSLWRTGGARNYITSMVINSNSTVSIPIAQVFNAGETLNMVSSAAGFDVNIEYADVAAAELPARYVDAASFTVASGFNTVHIAPVGGTVITSIMLGNLLGTSQRVSLLVGPPATLHAPVWRMPIPANGMLVLDDPLYLAATEILQMAVYDTDNSISMLASGYPAQS